MVAGQAGRDRGRVRRTGDSALVAVLDVAEDFQRVHVDRVQPFLHGGVVDPGRRLAEVTRRAGQPPRHRIARDDPDGGIGVDHVRADQQLLGLQVDHPVGMRSTDALGPYHLLQVRRDLVELVARTPHGMRSVGDRPEPTGPDGDGAGAALLLVVEHRQGRVHAGDVRRCGRRRTYDVGRGRGLGRCSGHRIEQPSADEGPDQTRGTAKDEATRVGTRVSHFCLQNSKVARTLSEVTTA